MLKLALKQLVIFPLFLTIVFAGIHLTFPVDTTYDFVEKTSTQHGEPNYLAGNMIGSIAPGQTLKLVIDRKSGKTFYWDNLELTVPDGWKKTSSKDALFFTYETVVPRNAELGTYELTLSASGDIQVLTPEILTISVKVRDDVYSFKADSSYPVHIDTSNLVPFSIRSESLASDSIKLSLEGIPSDWMGAKEIILSPNEERKTFFLVDPQTEGVYPVSFRAVSTLGAAGGTAPSELVVYPASLKSKLEVLNEGFSIVTVVLQPFYSLLSLIGSLL